MRERNLDDADCRQSNDGAQHTLGRRRFVGALAGGAAAGVGLSNRAGAQETPIVAMGNNQFDPIGLSIEPGTTVRFEIDDGSHSATAYEDRIPDGAAPFDSGTMSEGAFEHTFDAPGTYDYYCRPHRSMGMVGRIVVGEPGGPAEATSIPDGNVPDSEVIVEQGAVGIDEFEDAGGAAHGDMMGSGSGMMGGGGPGWMMLVPIGFFTAVAGLVGGAAYLGSRRGRSASSRGSSAMATLEEQYARGEIDEEDLERRRERLEGES